MLPDRVSNPGPLIDESGALPIALRDPVWHTNVQFADNRLRFDVLNPTEFQWESNYERF